MSYSLQTKNGSAIATNGTNIPLQNGGSPGAIIIYNASLVALIVSDTLGNQRFLPSMTADRYPVSQGQANVILYSIYTVTSGSGGNPDTISFVVLNESDYLHDRSTYPIPLGATLGMASVGQIINDGNPTGTNIIEATPSGASSSAVTLTNDGKLFVNSSIEYGASSGFATTPSQVGALWVSGGINGILASPLSGVGGGIGFASWNGVTRQFGLSVGAQVGAAATWVDGGGVVKQVAGQATAGSFGVPIQVAKAVVNIPNANLTTICTITTPAIDMFFSANLYIGTGANTNNPIITAQVNFTDPFTNTPGPEEFLQYIGGAAALSNQTLSKSSAYNVLPLTGYAKASTTITVQYQNSAAGTIADRVAGQIVLYG